MKNKLLTIAIFTLAFSGCFNDQQGNEASIILNLGGSTGNRAAWLHDEYSDILQEIVYKVVIDGPDHIEIESTGKTTIKTNVTSGIYSIKVEAWYSNAQYAKDSVENFTIKSGSNIVPIRLKPYMNPDKTYLIAGRIRMEFDTLAEALNKGRNDLGLKVFTVSIYNGTHLIYSDNGGIIDEGKTVTIENRGSGTATINLGVPNPEKGYEPIGSIFSIDGTLTLQGDITLEGIDENNSALIVVNGGGTFNMGRLNKGDNVVITGNNNNNNESDSKGGGVYVAIGANFIMNGGTIIGNTAEEGGGVCVYGGTFSMLDGTITNNTAGEGGGVYIGGRFVDSENIYYGIFNSGDENNGEKIRIFNNNNFDVYKHNILGIYYHFKGFIEKEKI
jgi:hypothetical protein